MRVDPELIEQVVEQILARLQGMEKAERLLVIGSRNDYASLQIPGLDRGVPRLLYTDEVAGGEEEQADRYILPRLELDDMVDLAMGRADSETAAMVRRLLLNGKTVEVIEYAFREFEKSAPTELIDLYTSYEKKLIGFGLRPLQQVRRSVRITRRVLSEKDIEQYAGRNTGSILVPRDAIVTPLAVESARKFGMEIQRD